MNSLNKNYSKLNKSNCYLLSKKSLLLFVIFISLSITLQAQTIHIVDKNPGAGAQYTNVQDAVDAATAGDIIYIQPALTTYGDIQMTKPLSIYGIGYNPELNNGQSSRVSDIRFGDGDASGSKISGLQISHIFLDDNTSMYNNHDIIITNNRVGLIKGSPTINKTDNVTISGNYLIRNGATIIEIRNSQNWIISNNIIEQPSIVSHLLSLSRFNSTTIFNNNIFLTRQNGNGNQSITVFFISSGAQISNNIFLFTGTGVENMDLGGNGNSSLNFQNNLTFSYSGTFDALSGTDNIDDTVPLFVAFDPNVALNTISNDFNLQGGSPGANAGTDGFDIGVFNGNFPFNMRGYPTELPYLTDFIIYNNIISAGTSLDVNVKANANNNQSNSALITAAEYFFDIDPGIGNATNIEITDTSNFDEDLVVDVPTDLAEGDHFLYIRVLNTAGEWSLYAPSEMLSTLSTPDFVLNNFKFYPNPVKDILYFDTNNQSIIDFKVIDLNGRVVLNNSPVNYQIDISHLSSGIYLFQIKTENGSVSKKFIKE